MNEGYNAFFVMKAVKREVEVIDERPWHREQLFVNQEQYMHWNFPLKETAGSELTAG